MRSCLPMPGGPNEQWDMVFVSDSLISGQRIRFLTILDLRDRSTPALKVDVSLSGQRVVGYRKACRDGWHAASARTTALSSHIWRWMSGARKHGESMEHSRPGKPTDNGFVESSNRKLRDKCLNRNGVESVPEAHH